jgi:hypothetical protein
MTYPTTVYLRKTDVPPGYVAVQLASAADLAKISGGFVYPTARDAILGVNPEPLHAGIVYPTTVYQKTDAAPGYVAVPVASEAEVLALSGAVFLTAENAIRYQAPPEQPMSHIARTDNFEQFVPGKSISGVPIAVPVARDNPLPGTYVRQGLPEAPPPDPPEV